MDLLGYDGLIALQPINVLYLTDYAPRMMHARWDVAYAAVLPRGVGKPVGLVAPAVELLFLAGRKLPVDRIEPYLAPLPDAAPLDSHEPAAAEFPGFPLRPGAALSPQLRSKLAITRKYGAHAAPTAAHAIARLLRAAGLDRARVAADDARAPLWLAQAGLTEITCVYEPSVLKEIRLVKTPVEIERMRAAACVNEVACRAVAARARIDITAADLDNAFTVECARRGSTATYLVADLGELPHGGIRRGEPLMLDALSHRDGYHGDFGRTLVVGTPDAELRRRATGLDAAWAAARGAIRPGNDYETVKAAAAEGARRADFPEFQAPTPHCLGLQHTDDPVAPGLHPGIKPNRVLEAGMVLNLDMPFIEWGWGALHREDTVLVTQTGCEVLTSDDETLIVV